MLEFDTGAVKYRKSWRSSDLALHPSSSRCVTFGQSLTLNFLTSEIRVIRSTF